MTRRLLVLLVTFLLCLSCAVPRRSVDFVDYQELVESVVAIQVSPTGLCSGFFIGPHRIISNAHCLIETPFQIYEVSTYQDYIIDSSLDNSSLYILVIADTVRDIAVFEEIFPDPSVTHTVPPRYLGSYPRVGTRTISVGHPAGQFFTVGTGIVSRIGHRHNNVSYLFSNAEIYYGSSGGPLFNERGEIIGMAKGIQREQAFLGQFISYAEIEEFLTELDEIENE